MELPLGKEADINARHNVVGRRFEEFDFRAPTEGDVRGLAALYVDALLTNDTSTLVVLNMHEALYESPSTVAEAGVAALAKLAGTGEISTEVTELRCNREKLVEFLASESALDSVALSELTVSALRAQDQDCLLAIQDRVQRNWAEEMDGESSALADVVGWALDHITLEGHVK